MSNLNARVNRPTIDELFATHLARISASATKFAQRFDSQNLKPGTCALCFDWTDDDTSVFLRILEAAGYDDFDYSCWSDEHLVHCWIEERK